MFVEGLLPVAREQLATVSHTAPLMTAAQLLSRTQVGLVIVCDTDNAVVGVVANSDVVRQIGHCAGSSCTEAVASVMTREVISCDPGQQLAMVWQTMKKHDLKHMPVVDGEQHPLGVLHAGDVLQALLGEVENEEELLREYVTGVGYR